MNLVLRLLQKEMVRSNPSYAIGSDWFCHVVYNPGGRSKIPRLYTIGSQYEQRLAELGNLDSFQLSSKTFHLVRHEADASIIQADNDNSAFAIPSITYVRDAADRKVELKQLVANDAFQPIDTFEVLSKGRTSTIVRNSLGYTTAMANWVRVIRASDLSRGPDGYSESKVALASFPVVHVVSHRTLRLNRMKRSEDQDGFITAYVGDAQSSVCINEESEKDLTCG